MIHRVDTSRVDKLMHRRSRQKRGLYWTRANEDPRHLRDILYKSATTLVEWTTIAYTTVSMVSVAALATLDAANIRDQIDG